MKNRYECLEINLLFLNEEDVIRTSQNDNVGEMPDFPETFED